MSNFSLAKFTTAIKDTGISRPSRFEIVIGQPVASDTAQQNNFAYAYNASLMCEMSQLPGISINTKQFRIQGPAYQRPVGMEFNGDSIAMTFYVDKDLKIKKFFENWVYSIVNPNSFNVKYQQEYVVPIKIFQLNEKDVRTYTVSLIDAFPKAIGQLDLNSGASNQIHRLTVIFTYRQWMVEYPYRTKDDYQDNIKSPYQFQPLSKT
jgi:hypothetical protein